MRFKTLIIWMKKIVIFVISFESNWHAFNWKSCSIILLNKQALRIQPPTHKILRRCRRRYQHKSLHLVWIQHHPWFCDCRHTYLLLCSSSLYDIYLKNLGSNFTNNEILEIFLRCKRFWEFVVNSCEFEVKDNKFIRLK